MYYNEVKVEFDAAHFLKLGYSSPCTGEHGHCWEVTVKIAATDVNEHGMVTDFALVKSKIREYDHKVINKIPPFDRAAVATQRCNPTAENLARVICDEVNELCGLEMNKPICYEVQVRETKGNMAKYTMEEK